jgi:hypothetical protein
LRCQPTYLHFFGAALQIFTQIQPQRNRIQRERREEFFQSASIGKKEVSARTQKTAKKESD